VLANFLQYYVKRNGTIAYRGLEMAQAGRMLSAIAQFASYTGDPSSLLLRYFDKIQGIVSLLRARRMSALQLPVDDARFGMPTGHDEADAFTTWAQERLPSPLVCSCSRSRSLPLVTPVFGLSNHYSAVSAPLQDAKYGNTTTELPFVSIATEMYRGFTELGKVWLGLAANRSGTPRTVQAEELLAEGHRMLQDAAGLLTDIRNSMLRSVVQTGQPASPRCWPYVAAGGVCSELRNQSTARDSEPWRTYAEMAWSAVLDDQTFADILNWNRMNAQSMRLSVLTGSGSDCCGNDLMTFTALGWGFGLLYHGAIESFLMWFYTVSSHSNTRGTWTAPEEVSIGEDGLDAMPYATSSQLVQPIALKWMLVYENPNTAELHLAAGLPRDWLRAGRRGSISNTPTRYGRLSLSYASTLAGDDRSGRILFNVTLPPLSSAPLGATLGGIVLHVRLPEGPVSRIERVLLSEEIEWTDFDPQLEEIRFSVNALATPALRARLHSIQVVVS
jgi:hypothetical protein